MNYALYMNENYQTRQTYIIAATTILSVFMYDKHNQPNESQKKNQKVMVEEEKKNCELWSSLSRCWGWGWESELWVFSNIEWVEKNDEEQKRIKNDLPYIDIVYGNGKNLYVEYFPASQSQTEYTHSGFQRWISKFELWFWGVGTISKIKITLHL